MVTYRRARRHNVFRKLGGGIANGASHCDRDWCQMSAALELAPFGVTANMVDPPVTDTGWVTRRTGGGGRGCSGLAVNLPGHQPGWMRRPLIRIGTIRT